MPERVGEPPLEEAMGPHDRLGQLASLMRSGATVRSPPTAIHPSAASRFSVTLIVGALTPTHSAIRPGRTLGSSNSM